MLRAQVAVILLYFLLPSSTLAQVSQNVLAEDQPVWELGAGAITLNNPDYPGSKNSRVRVVPFPYYIYRGKYVRADDEGTRARFFFSKYHETGLSFGLNFPVNSGDNPARLGMPNLDALFSFGPRILLRILADSKNQQLNLSLGARAVFSSKVSLSNLLRYQGYTFEPRMSYWYKWRNSKVTLFSSLGLELGTSKYNQFFYDVHPIYETPTRPTYHAKAGLVEAYISMGVGKSIGSWFLFAASSWRNLDASANINSSLVETTNNMGMIVGAVWTFFESEEKVKRLQGSKNLN